MKGGAVRLDRSPLKDAMDYRHRSAEVSAECFADRDGFQQPTPFICAGQGEGRGGSVAPMYLEEGGPAAALGRLRIWLCGVGHDE
jgi:hypothetical protein